VWLFTVAKFLQIMIIINQLIAVNMKKKLTFLGILMCLLPLLESGTGTLQAQNIIGGANGDASAILDLQSSSKGLLIPRMTSTERSAVANPAAGLMIYNTTLSCVEINVGSSSSPDWLCLAGAGKVASLDCSGAVQTGNLVLGTAASGVSVALGYTGGNGNNYGVQTVTSTGVTGLTATLSPGTFAVSGGSLTYTISGTPSAAGTASFALSIGGQSCTLSLTPVCSAFVASGVSKAFMCHNLGANTSADPFTPSWELNGNYYQWGRNPTCFGRDGVDDTNPCSSPVYGAAAPWGNTTSNDNAGAITGWNTTPAADGAWADGSKTVNDPCPAGWRVPTATQLAGLTDNTLNPRTSVGSWTESSTNFSVGYRFGQSLFLPAAGGRSVSDGSLFRRGNDGYYWSSTENGSSAQLLYIYGSDAYMGPNNRIFGFSVRCVAE
jgi:uncharacterized protein (TIGR02145 family)